MELRGCDCLSRRPVNTHPTSDHPRNEHHAEAVGSTLLTSHTNLEPPSFNYGRVIGFLPPYPDYSPNMQSHCVQALNEVPKHFISMVNHSIALNHVYYQYGEPKFDLWAHLKQIKSFSFNRAIKRKRERNEETSLCSVFNSLAIARRKPISLETAMKKLCLNVEAVILRTWRII